MTEVSKGNMLLQKLDEAIQKSGCNSSLISAIKTHLQIINHYFNDKISNRQDICELLLSNFFIANPDKIFTNKRFACQIDNNFNFGVKIQPSEVLTKEKVDEVFRREMFYECLKVADVLDCIVDTIFSPAYQLKVVHKYGSDRLLSDLNIPATLPMTASEISLIKGNLTKGELIRVAVFRIQMLRKETSVIEVTLDENTLQFSKTYIKLGKITLEEIPSYLFDLSDVSKCANLTEYLKSCPEFQKPLPLNSILCAFGLNNEKVYSFFPELEKTCPEEMTGQRLLQKARAKDVANYLALAESQLKNGCFTTAFDYLEEVFNFEPQNVKALKIRGMIHAEVNKKKSEKAVSDFETVLQHDPNCATAKEYLSKALFVSAVKFSKRNMYDKAYTACQDAIELDKNNSKAAKLLAQLKASSNEAVMESLKSVIQPMPKNLSVCASTLILKSIENPFTEGIFKNDSFQEESNLEEKPLDILKQEKNKLEFELKKLN